jgi:hypothetical protein
VFGTGLQLVEPLTRLRPNTNCSAISRRCCRYHLAQLISRNEICFRNLSNFKEADFPEHLCARQPISVPTPSPTLILVCFFVRKLASAFKVRSKQDVVTMGPKMICFGCTFLASTFSTRWRGQLLRNLDCDRAEKLMLCASCAIA